MHSTAFSAWGLHSDVRLLKYLTRPLAIASPSSPFALLFGKPPFHTCTSSPHVVARQVHSPHCLLNWPRAQLGVSIESLLATLASQSHASAVPILACYIIHTEGYLHNCCRCCFCCSNLRTAQPPHLRIQVWTTEVYNVGSSCASPSPSPSPCAPLSGRGTLLPIHNRAPLRRHHRRLCRLLVPSAARGHITSHRLHKNRPHQRSSRRTTRLPQSKLVRRHTRGAVLARLSTTTLDGATKASIAMLVRWKMM